LLTQSHDEVGPGLTGDYAGDESGQRQGKQEAVHSG